MGDVTAKRGSRDSNPEARRWKSLLQWILIAGSLWGVFHPGIAGHLRNAAKPLVFTEDARIIIWPLLRYHHADLFPNDPIARYVLDCLPSGYSLLFETLGAAVDPRVVSKVLPYVLMLVTLVALGLAGHRLGGPATAWSAMALCLASSVFLARMIGSLPRAFAYPSLALTAAALVAGRPYWVAFIVVVGAAFYPVAAVVSGLALAVYLLVLSCFEGGEGPVLSVRRRLAVLAITAVVATLFVIPPAMRSRSYGPVLGPQDVRAYPEIGPGGRWLPDTRAPFDGFLRGTAREAWRTLANPQRAWTARADRFLKTGEPAQAGWGGIAVLAAIAIAAAVTAAGLGRLLWKRAAARRLMALAIGAFLGHALARYFAPHLFAPQRYLAYAIPLLVVVVFPAAVSSLADLLIRARRRQWLRPATTVAVCGVFALGLGGRSLGERGYTVHISGSTAIYRFVASLPKDSLIAGWPNGVVQNVPYLSARPVFVSEETHLVFHRAYADEMRRRMRVLVDAYFAREPGPLLRLRDEFGVTHLLIDANHYSGDRAGYFKPFDEWIQRAYDEMGPGEPETLRQIPRAGVFREGAVVVLDLARLPGPRQPSYHPQG